jgi:MFS transporter, putative metabolite:H+ symporter
MLLTVLGIAGFFEGYDSYVFTVALPQIRESFGLSQSGASLWLSVLFLGSIPAIFVTRYADLRGRRRMLFLSIIGYSLFTGITALSPNMGFFVYSQFIARLFLNAECALAWTIVAEEIPARSRGFGFGWLAMLSAVGSAMGSLLFGLVFAPLGVSWRWLYFLALPPLLTVLMMQKKFPETGRYREARKTGHLATKWHDILRKPHRKWFLLIGFTDLLFALVTIADVFAIDYMQTDRGLSPTTSNLILVVSGVLAIPVLLWAGSLSDRYGRKLVGCFFGTLSVFGVVGLFYAARGPVMIFVFLLLTLVGQFGAWPTLDAYYTELFPTGLRAFAGSSASVWRVPGESLSLILGAALIKMTGGLGSAAMLLALGPLLAVLIIWRFFPETKGLELEEISAELGDSHPTVDFVVRPPTVAARLRAS